MAAQGSQLVDRLEALAVHWLESAQRRRSDADAETDKVWSARQYGIADTEEDAADEIRKFLARVEQNLPLDIEPLVARWAVLASEVMYMASSDDNRLTAAYRRAGHEAYLRLIEELREAVTSVGRPNSEPKSD